MSEGIKSQDDLTFQYVTILKTNNDIRENERAGVSESSTC
jgi:hypothetical protein